jgi:hypothetical protein
LDFAEYVILFFEVVVLGSGEGTMKKRSILRVNEEVKVEMVRDNGRGWGGRHEQKEVSCRGGITVNVGLYTLLVILQHDRDLIRVPTYCPQWDNLST